MARRRTARPADPQAGLRPGVEVVHVGSPTELLTVPPEARAWGDPEAWAADYDAVEPGAIVRLRPPHLARTNPSLVRNARDHFAARGAVVRVEQPAPGPAVTGAAPTPAPHPTHRAVVEAELAAAHSAAEDGGAELRAVVGAAMDEEGL